jgi:hypothetical protein
MNSGELIGCKRSVIVDTTSVMLILLIILLMVKPYSGQHFLSSEVILIFLIPASICTFIAYRSSLDESTLVAQESTSPV